GRRRRRGPGRGAGALRQRPRQRLVARTAGRAEGVPVTATLHDAGEVVAFWRAAGYRKWFQGGADFDDLCRARLLEAHHAAARRELEGWMAHAEGALALMVLLDQVPRNVFRGSGHAFATDPLARHYAGR